MEYPEHAGNAYQYQGQTPPNTKPIPGAERYSIAPNGAIYNERGWRLKSYDNMGYRYIALRPTPTSKRKSYCVHRLVYEAHVGPIPPTYWINHKDGVKDNNDIENLEAVTPSENHLHAVHVLKRRSARGSETGMGKLSDEAVVIIRELCAKGYTQTYLAKAFSVSQCAISHIINNKTWNVVDADPCVIEDPSIKNRALSEREIKLLKSLSVKCPVDFLANLCYLSEVAVNNAILSSINKENTL